MPKTQHINNFSSKEYAEMSQQLSPNKFAEEVERIIEQNKGIPATARRKLDELCWQILINELGYAKGVNLIKGKVNEWSM